LKFNDVQKDQTYRAEVDETTGLEEKIITDSKNKAMVPSCDVIDANGEIVGTYNFPVGGHLVVEDGQTIKTGEVLVKIPRAVGGAGDITGGLPRVADLFEARKPKEHAILAEVSGIVSFGKETKGKNRLVITPDDGSEIYEELIPKWRTMNVFEGEHVNRGETVSDGPQNPHDILRLKGEVALTNYIVNEVQDVYRLQGVKINDKHIEVIVRQMLRKVDITDGGDTSFIKGEQVDYIRVVQENQAVLAQNKFPAKFEQSPGIHQPIPGRCLCIQQPVAPH
jgi:DNA-directed RNA polymerase subunit beta'